VNFLIRVQSFKPLYSILNLSNPQFYSILCLPNLIHTHPKSNKRGTPCMYTIKGHILHLQLEIGYAHTLEAIDCGPLADFFIEYNPNSAALL
jgi:hypothetical protein